MRISTMMSSRSLTSLLGGPIVLSGHLRKLKTLKKKYFVLRAEATGCPACLEYYDNKKKFENNQPPKRSISLHSCFNINKRSDTKQKNVIALYTKDECFCIVLDNEKDMGKWLNAMLLLQNGEQPDGEQPRPTFEHVWQVTIQKKALGERANIHGPYRLCLSDAALTVVKVGTKDTSDFIEFPLVSIRRCGFKDRIFYMEMGRSAITGYGEFWMETEDNNIARNMHAVILNAMSNSNANKDEVGPRQEMKSSSANEKKMIPDRPGTWTTGTASTNDNSSTTNRRRHSVASHPHSADNSQSAHANTTSSTTTTTTTSTTSTAITATATITSTTATNSHQRTLSLPLAAVTINQTQSSKRSVLWCTCERERWDSLHSQARTTSEGHTTPTVLGHSNMNDRRMLSVILPNHVACALLEKEFVLEDVCGSSPSRGGEDYVSMSSSTTHLHSRSSLLEMMNMTLAGDDGYVQMDPLNNQNDHFLDNISALDEDLLLDKSEHHIRNSNSCSTRP